MGRVVCLLGVSELRRFEDSSGLEGCHRDFARPVIREASPPAGTRSRLAFTSDQDPMATRHRASLELQAHHRPHCGYYLLKVWPPEFFPLSLLILHTIHIKQYIFCFVLDIVRVFIICQSVLSTVYYLLFTVPEYYLLHYGIGANGPF
ncbi:hypothetical protein NMY22_g3901 [Coprinellus aureogranulatus]|nr:hypothetical protein NMY22_g3901 [Coprinellus aureogranulatus]